MDREIIRKIGSAIHSLGMGLLILLPILVAGDVPNDLFSRIGFFIIAIIGYIFIGHGLIIAIQIEDYGKTEEDEKNE